MDEDDWKVSFWICLVLLVIVCLIAFDYADGNHRMGQAICEKEYGMDYDGWGFNNKLICKQPEIRENYDGLGVIIAEEN